jgi:SAM-dependent methyltransferase
VEKAPASAAYLHVQQALGDAMPYPGETFASAFSNSVLEHIPDLMPVLHEVARVLKPGGRFIATVPSDAFRRLLAGYRKRIAVGDFDGAEAYATTVDQRLEHHRYPSPTEWSEMFDQAGMQLTHARYYIPAEVEELWDSANHTYGINEDGSQIYRWLASPRLRKFGYQLLIQRQVVRTLSKRWRYAYELDVPDGGVGGGLMVIAEKLAKSDV